MFRASSATAHIQTPSSAPVPEKPTQRDGFLYGRGAADMKGSLAAMVSATEAFVNQHPSCSGRIAFLITSDEEGIATHGTTRVVDWLVCQDISPEWCIVGEPSSVEALGDTIKNGRRGSLNCQLIIKGIEGHVAYPLLADNPIHRAVPFLTELTQTHWDNGNQHFPATTLQLSNIHAGAGTTNVIPGELTIDFNFRFSSEISSQELQARVLALLAQHQLSYEINWQLSGEPFLTTPGALVEAVRESIKNHTGLTTELSTSGGTSDGRFIARLGTQVVELGPVNTTIHKVNECVAIEDLDTLSDIYLGVLSTLIG